MSAGEALWPKGCLVLRISFTDEPASAPDSIMWSRWSKSPFPLLESRSSAACVFPLNMRLANLRARLDSDFLSRSLSNRCWMALPSSTSDSRSPYFHVLRRLSRQAISSFGLDLRWGCCKTRSGKTMVALRATHSRADTSAKAEKSLQSSSTSDLPALPEGILKQFFLQ